MFQFDPLTGSIEVPIWGSAALAAILVVLAALALMRTGVLRTLGVLAAVVVLGLGGWAGLNYIDRMGGVSAVGMSGPGADDRRIFDQRVTELTGRAMAPGSPLSCLDGTAGEQVAIGCEKLIFSGPETISSAVTYIAARVALLTEGTALARQSGASVAASYEPSLNALRRGLESDRFGIVAYLLLQQPECTADQCEALSVFHDSSRLRSNLRDRPFDVLVTRYSSAWQLAGRGTGADGGPLAANTGPLPAGAGPVGTPVSSKYDFPSSASIPPVSIMNTEPPAPAEKTPAAKPAEQPAAKPAPKPAAAAKPAPAHNTRASAAPPKRDAQPTQLAPQNARPPAGTAASEE